MGFSFSMRYKPTYQKRRGKCTICQMSIEAGSQVMAGSGYFNGLSFKNHSHYGCWLAVVQKKAEDWFFANGYKPTVMAPEIKAELNRLRAKRYYIKKKGGEPNEMIAKLEEVEKQIVLVKNGK